MGIRILIPCKPLNSGKTRLAGVLPEQERAALCASLLAQTIALAAGIAPTTVVTSTQSATRSGRAGSPITTLVSRCRPKPSSATV